ncbi:MAG: class I SAM-dependent methyltransferase [Chloroflexota bacterium]|nr:class I SAM-dependent methyltransferase [Chloroflexota bacterium]MDE2948635.1 class I SAM-dependent methyltransferase [Chloroflexota bacterium]
MTEPQDSKSLSKARYTRFADGYVVSETHARGSDLDRLLAIVAPQPHWRALDVATGGGHTALKFAPAVAHVIASDLTPRMLEKARRFIVEEKGVGNISFEQADAEALPFEDDRFDLVTCRIAPHHFPDAQRFVEECARVLKPGGLFMLQDQVLPMDPEAARFVDAFERLRDPSHNRAYNDEEWMAMFKRAGISVEHSEHYLKRHDFLTWARRQGNDEATIAQLIQMLHDAPPNARAWMDPQNWGSENATFLNRHILIRGRVG